MQKNNPTSIVLATRNKGKIAEISALLEGFPVLVKNLDDFGPIPEVEEDGETFEENAYKKASFTARILGIPAIADDSGLMVDALDKAPGVHSARIAGPDATDRDRCQKLLQAMQTYDNRGAAFACVISIAVPTGPALTYEGECRGVLTREPQGENGFGYDPIFYFTPLKKTFAQLTREEKSRVSHRGKALREVQEEFDNVLAWIDIHMPTDEKFNCQA